MKYLLIILTTAFSINAGAQNKDSLTDADYAHAEKFLFYNTSKYIDHANVNANWIGENEFWYRDLVADGSRFVFVDAATGKKSSAFDEQKAAAAVSAATGKSYKANRLPFQSFEYSDDRKSISFSANGKRWKLSLQDYKLTQNSDAKKNDYRDRNAVISPDGTKAAFIKNYNLWVKDLNTGKETQLTTDGVENYGYATDNAGWTHNDAAILRWSPDSKKIATFQQDQRKVGDMYLVTTNVGHPELKAWKYPLPGDSTIIMIERVIINVDNPKVIRLQIPPDPHRGTLSDDISSSGTFDDVDWSADGEELAFVSTSRDHKQEKFRIANANTGAVR